MGWGGGSVRVGTPPGTHTRDAHAAKAVVLSLSKKKKNGTGEAT